MGCGLKETSWSAAWVASVDTAVLNGVCLSVVEDLDAEQDEMDSSVGSMLDTSAGGATDKSITTPQSMKHRTSGVTGGRSGLKLSRQKDDKTVKSLEPTVKKSLVKLPRGSTGERRCSRRRSSVEAEARQMTTTADEPTQSEVIVDKTGAEEEKRGPLRITRRSSDLKLGESDSVLQGDSVISTGGASENVSDADLSAETD